MKIAILGGGISGCALARMLAGDGHDVKVLEKTERIGGLCKSRSYDGFTFDEAGGHIIFSKDQDVLQWQLDRCGGDAGTQKTVRNTKIRWHDRWVLMLGAACQLGSYMAIRLGVQEPRRAKSGDSTAG